MLLHEDKPRFQELIDETSEAFELVPSIIEKDYYVTCILKRIVENVPSIVFKGGTALSKCFQVIQRFSEDVDISFGNGKNRPTQKQRKDTNQAVRHICQENGFGRCILKDEFRSNRVFNSAVIEYGRLSGDTTVESKIIVELSQFSATYPVQEKSAATYITDYLKKKRDQKTIGQFNLEPFPVSVQTLERTFVDKVFALCDYYLRGEITRNSRHIYDLYCLYPQIEMSGLGELAKEVRVLRMGLKLALSARPECSVKDTLAQIVSKRYFMQDYNQLTRRFLFKDVPYTNAISVLSKIIDLDIFD